MVLGRRSHSLPKPIPHEISPVASNGVIRVAIMFSPEQVESAILIIRGHKVTLDSDLAVLYKG